jgi:hypothetical protein
MSTAPKNKNCHNECHQYDLLFQTLQATEYESQAFAVTEVLPPWASITMHLLEELALNK